MLLADAIAKLQAISRQKPEADVRLNSREFPAYGFEIVDIVYDPDRATATIIFSDQDF